MGERAGGARAATSQAGHGTAPGRLFHSMMTSEMLAVIFRSREDLETATREAVAGHLGIADPSLDLF